MPRAVASDSAVFLTVYPGYLHSRVTGILLDMCTVAQVLSQLFWILLALPWINALLSLTSIHEEQLVSLFQQCIDCKRYKNKYNSYCYFIINR
jgi:uncharacterized membrane protein YbhN (UPF0104 family)